MTSYASCKRCNCNERGVAVYRCSKCSTLFCDECGGRSFFGNTICPGPTCWGKVVWQGTIRGEECNPAAPSHDEDPNLIIESLVVRCNGKKYKAESYSTSKTVIFSRIYDDTGRLIKEFKDVPIENREQRRDFGRLFCDAVRADAGGDGVVEIS